MYECVKRAVKKFVFGETGENPYGMAGAIIVVILLIVAIWKMASSNLNGSLTSVGGGLSTAGGTAGSGLSGMD